MKIRQATLEDFDQINEITGVSYGFDAASAKERMYKRFEFTFKENYCVEVDGKIVANARYLLFDQNIRGKFVKMGGIGMVASDPQYRRQGYIRELMKFLLEKMRTDKCAVSTLYPFKDTFYARFGYVNGAADLFLKINPYYFNRWKKLPNGYRVERLSHEEGFQHYKSIHEKAMGKIHGGVKRGENRWKEYDNPGPGFYAVAFNEKNEAEGVMKYFSKGYGSGFSWSEDGKMDLQDILYLTPNARRALYNFIFLYTDQVQTVKYPITAGESELYPWLQDYCMVDVEKSNIWMSRIIDIPRTLNNLQTTKDGELKIQINDIDYLENNKIFDFTSRNNVLKVEISDSTKADFELSIQGLTSIVYGFLTSFDIESFDWIKNPKEEHLNLLNDWFPLKIPRLTEGF